jgi:hypothetical protein
MSQLGAPPALDGTLCPPPGMPGPGYVPPPWFLLRITGQGPAGAVSAELLTSCTTFASP